MLYFLYNFDYTGEYFMTTNNTKYHRDYIVDIVHRIYDKSAPMLLTEGLLFAFIGDKRLTCRRDNARKN